MHDLVVVGAGPAGSRLARRFAERGSDIVVLERGEVGVPLACSGHVSDDLWDFLPDGARAELVGNKIRGARFHVGESTYEFYKDETVSYAIDRVGMDRVLADEARAAGADLRTETPVEHVDEHDDGVTVATDTDEYETRLVAGCDGPRSTVRDELGLDTPDELLQGVLGFTDERGANTDDLVDVYVDVPDFFGWRIPRGDSVEYGAASSGSPREHLEDVAGIDMDGFDRLCAGQIPIGPPARTTTDRGFLVGDAAAQTKPFTGGGIVYGMTAADIAARTVEADAPETLAAYDDEWRDELGREIRLGGALRRAYELPRPVQRAGLRAFEGEINVHMDRPSTLFNRATARRVFRNVFGV